MNSHAVQPHDNQSKAAPASVAVASAPAQLSSNNSVMAARAKMHAYQGHTLMHAYQGHTFYASLTPDSKVLKEIDDCKNITSTLREAIDSGGLIDFITGNLTTVDQLIEIHARAPWAIDALRRKHPIEAVMTKLVTVEQIGRLTKEQTESILKINTAAEVGERVKEYLSSQSKATPAPVAMPPSPTPVPVTSFVSPNSSKLVQAKEKVTSATQTKEDEVAKKILNIQRYYRGHLARKKYRITHLAQRHQTQYATCVTGNDPKIPVEQLAKYQAKAGEQIALIGTSGLRSVLLACQLTAKDEKSIPKIIIIDESVKVYQFWNKMREFAYAHNTAASFLAVLPEFLSKNASLFQTGRDLILIFFLDLFQQFNYSRVKSIIINTTFIRQSWADKKTFSALKNICSRLNIGNVYAYPSNIIGCELESVVGRILENIQFLQPKLAIHTNYCEGHKRPDEVHLITKHDEPGLASKLRNPCSLFAKSTLVLKANAPASQSQSYLGFKKGFMFKK